jgi:hypothetical protein
MSGAYSRSLRTGAVVQALAVLVADLCWLWLPGVRRPDSAAGLRVAYLGLLTLLITYLVTMALVAGLGALAAGRAGRRLTEIRLGRGARRAMFARRRFFIDVRTWPLPVRGVRLRQPGTTPAAGPRARWLTGTVTVLVAVAIAATVLRGLLGHWQPFALVGTCLAAVRTVLPAAGRRGVNAAGEYLLVRNALPDDMDADTQLALAVAAAAGARGDLPLAEGIAHELAKRLREGDAMLVLLRAGVAARQGRYVRAAEFASMLLPNADPRLRRLVEVGAAKATLLAIITEQLPPDTALPPMVAALRRSKARRSSSVQAELVAALAALVAGEFAVAEEHAAEAEQDAANPVSLADALCVRALACCGLGQRRTAHRLLSRARRLWPGHPLLPLVQQRADALDLPQDTPASA